MNLFRNFGLNYSSVQQSSGLNFGPGPNCDITTHTPIYIAHNNLHTSSHLLHFFLLMPFIFMSMPNPYWPLASKEEAGPPNPHITIMLPLHLVPGQLAKLSTIICRILYFHPSCPFLCHSTSGQKVAGDRRQVVQDEEEHCVSDRM